jgi:hypothetical protein
VVALGLGLQPAWAEAGSNGQATRPEGATYEAEASVPLRGGNTAAARQGAVSAALRAAVEEAARNIGGQLGPDALSRAIPQPENYIMSYRILTEETAPEPAPAQLGMPPQVGIALPPTRQATSPEAEMVYTVRIEALVSLGALKHSLRALGQLQEGLSLPPVAVSISEASGIDPARAQEMLLAALSQGGFTARMAQGGARPGEMALAGRLKSNCAGVCRAEVSLTGREAGHTHTGTGSVVSQTAEEALAGALKAAVGSLSGQLAALRRPVPVMLSLRGMMDYPELAQVKAALDQMGLSGRERSLRSGEIVLEVRLAGSRETLARQLAQTGFSGFRLAPREGAPGFVVFDVVRLSPSSAQ